MKFAVAALIGLVGASTLNKDYDPVPKYYTPFDHEATYYERVTPARFSADSDDIFMRSMNQQYALEAKGAKDAPNEGEPTGHFWMNEATTRAAASEVLATHKGLSGAALASYLDTYFPRTWAHFDVNRGGFVEVIKMPMLMRFLASDQYMSLGE